MTNKIDTPERTRDLLLRIRQRIETSFENSRPDLGFGDYEMQTDEGVVRYWYHLMDTYRFVRLGPKSNSLRTVHSKNIIASSEPNTL
jgi:hypothetical protein